MPRSKRRGGARGGAHDGDEELRMELALARAAEIKRAQESQSQPQPQPHVPPPQYQPQAPQFHPPPPQYPMAPPQFQLPPPPAPLPPPPQGEASMMMPPIDVGFLPTGAKDALASSNPSQARAIRAAGAKGAERNARQANFSCATPCAPGSSGGMDDAWCYLGSRNAGQYMQQTSDHTFTYKGDTSGTPIYVQKDGSDYYRSCDAALEADEQLHRDARAAVQEAAKQMSRMRGGDDPLTFVLMVSYRLPIDVATALARSELDTEDKLITAGLQGAFASFVEGVGVTRAAALGDRAVMQAWGKRLGRFKSAVGAQAGGGKKMRLPKVDVGGGDRMERIEREREQVQRELAEGLGGSEHAAPRLAPLGGGGDPEAELQRAKRQALKMDRLAKQDREEDCELMRTEDEYQRCLRDRRDRRDKLRRLARGVGDYNRSARG